MNRTWICDGCGTRYEKMPDGTDRRVSGESPSRIAVLEADLSAANDTIEYLRATIAAMAANPDRSLDQKG